MNLEITVDALDPFIAALAGVPLFLEPEEREYRAGDEVVRVRQLCVQDPDRYLVRLAEVKGARPL